MRVAIGSDHAGFELKEILRAELAELGDEVMDYGTDSLESCDYPDIAVPLARAVAAGEHDFGILICSNGVGPSIVGPRGGVPRHLLQQACARAHGCERALHGCVGDRAWRGVRGDARVPLGFLRGRPS